MTFKRSDYELNGELRKYTDVGCYPVFYVDKDNSCLCADCANNNDEEVFPLVAADVNWEDPELYCDECGERIESAYADN